VTTTTRRRYPAAPLPEHQARFLAVLRELLPSGQGTFEAARRCGQTPKRIQRWRDRSARFKKAMDQIKAQGEVAQQAIQEALVKADLQAAEGEGMAPAQAVFLAIWRREQDRMIACERAGLRWTEVKAMRASDPSFEAACLEVEEEIRIRIEDARTREAIHSGGSAANAVLKSAEKKPAAPGASRRDRVAQLRAEKGAPN
jgi:hypothetical protein